VKQYHDLLRAVLEQGQIKSSRGKLSDGTHPKTRSLFGYQMKFDLNNGFPLVTTKKIHVESVIHELLWFLRGDTNVSYLQKHGVRIWNEWADESGDCGPIYGYQWRRWNGAIDQIANVIDLLKRDPDSRRAVVSAWNASDIPEMALPPCHAMFQFYAQDGNLSLQLYQRSADVFLGVPFNIASYSLLLCLVAQVCGMHPHMFIHTFGDVHLYENHIEQAYLQLSRESFALPELKVDPSVRNIDDFRREHIEIVGYRCHPAIRGEVAV